MAGKTWSEEEEAYFWLHIVPFSRRRRGTGLANPELSFQQLGEKMQTAFGQKARRQYTALCLEEHFYQNVETGRPSKKARKWVKKYKALAKEYPGLPQKSTRAAQEANGEVEATHVATKPGAETDWELGGDENAEKLQDTLRLAQAEPADTTALGKGKGKRGREVSEVPANEGEEVRVIDEGEQGRTEEHSTDGTRDAKELAQAAIRSMAREDLVGGCSFPGNGSTVDEGQRDEAAKVLRDLARPSRERFGAPGPHGCLWPS